MNIELTSEEASMLVGILTVWLQRIPRFSKEYECVNNILDKVFAEDKKQVDHILNNVVIK